MKGSALVSNVTAIILSEFGKQGKYVEVNLGEIFLDTCLKPSQ